MSFYPRIIEKTDSLVYFQEKHQSNLLVTVSMEIYVELLQVMIAHKVFDRIYVSTTLQPGSKPIIFLLNECYKEKQLIQLFETYLYIPIRIVRDTLSNLTFLVLGDI